MRILLFAMTNVAVLLVFGVIARIFGLDQWIYQSTGINYTGLLIWCALFGMGGSLVSLMLSKTIAKTSMRVQLIKEPQSEQEQWLHRTVVKLAEEAGIGMPEIGIFPDQAANAFATGASKNNALVAVSAGLLQRFDRDSVEAVLGHEIAHVANGDMVTMTLLQGVLNTFVLFISRVLGSIIDQAVFKNENGRGMGSFLISMVLQVVFGFLASMITCWFSRYREFRADAGGAQYAGGRKMIRALQSLQAEQHPAHMPERLAAFGIRPAGGVKALFATHPPLAERIERLQQQLA